MRKSAATKKRERAELILELALRDRDFEQIDIVDSDTPFRRIAVVDVCNVLHCSAGLAVDCDPKLKPYLRKPDAIGLLMVTRHLLENDYDVRLILPASYMSESKVENLFILEEFKRLGLLHILPIFEFDDPKILEMASKTGGFIISNDKFYDHVIRENQDIDVLDVIRNHIVPYKFTRVNRPRDFSFLSHLRSKFFTGIDLVFDSEKKDVMMANATDHYFTSAFFHRQLFSKRKTDSYLSIISLIYDYLQQRFCLTFGVQSPRLIYFNPKFQELPSSFEQFRQLYDEYIEEKD